MALFDRVVAEMQRRAALLSEEVTDWTNNARVNKELMGIHKSQFERLEEMMGGLLTRQAQLLKDLSPVLSSQQFGERFLRLLREIAGTNDLWRIFRYIFTQLQEERLGPLVDAAHLVSADCYLTCLNRLRAWGLISEQQFREPPLVYLEADISPATASRGQKVQALGFPVRQYRNLRLPIPIVSLPFDHANCMWLFCALHHEVGHNLDQDLKLTCELKQHLDAKLKAEDNRRTIWKRWAGEILADVFGVLLGGAGFGHSLTSLLLVTTPLWATLDIEGEHPDNHVRIYLVTEMLRETGVGALVQAADAIVEVWDAQAKPVGIEPYLKDGKAVVQVFLTQRLRALGGRPLRDLVQDPAGDVKKAADLAKFFRTGSGFDQPVDPVPWRLVPVAAQARLMELDQPDAGALDLLQERSFKYLKGLKRPDFLAAADRNKFLQQLVDEIDFTAEGDS